MDFVTTAPFSEAEVCGPRFLARYAEACGKRLAREPDDAEERVLPFLGDDQGRLRSSLV